MNPEQIGCYKIKAELGRGGMATVYQAYDSRFEREVAIKILSLEMVHDPQFRVRFEREAKTIAMLENPAIVPVYDFGEKDGQPYFVMRYMSGGSLSDRIKKGPIPILEVARIIGHIAPALDEAHAKGIIHRDLKPGNILFDRTGESYVSDFGIAKFPDKQSNVTGSAIIGTPSYMSPEQALGEGVDGRSDIYAIGIILFEMLTGHQPYKGDTPMSVVVKHITEPVPHILDIYPNLPSTIESVIEKAMAKDKNERFATVQELAEVLSAVARGASPDIKIVPAPTRVVSPSEHMPQTSSYILRYRLNTGPWQEHPLSEGNTILGRQKGCTIVLQHSKVSRLHTRLTYTGDKLGIADLGSTNGTFLEGKRLPTSEFVPLEPGQIVEIGPYTLVVALTDV
jgi:serine/threonine-protein kinase